MVTEGIMGGKTSNVDNFIKEYILTGCKDGPKACIKAGYSKKTASQQASRLLKNVKVQQAIKEYKKADLKLFIKTKEQKLQMLEDIAKVCMEHDGEKGMINVPGAVSAIKEHNAMQGDNAPIKTENKNVELSHEQWLESLE